MCATSTPLHGAAATATAAAAAFSHPSPPSCSSTGSHHHCPLRHCRVQPATIAFNHRKTGGVMAMLWFSEVPTPELECYVDCGDNWVAHQLFDEMPKKNNVSWTGKTYLWKTLSTAIRSKGEIVLTIASSGISSLLLTGGRTAHYRFHIPINLNEDSTCYMDPGTDEAQLLEKTRLIIWYEAPMAHKRGFQALDRSLKDVLSSNLLFGRKVVVFGGDFGQILPVVQKGTRQYIVNAFLCSSYIWSEFSVLRLTKNLRLTMGGPSSDVEETKLFVQWLLDIGEGNVGGPNDGVATIDIPDDLLIKDYVDPLSKLFNFVYHDILQNYENQHYFQDRAILAPTNEIVDEINDSLLKFFPGDEVEYLSSDTICSSEYINDMVDAALYSPELLNGLRISGLPNHKLVLKVGVPVMLLRNLNQKEDLCNDTRLQIVSLGTRVVEAKIISGTNIGHTVLIHRSPLTPTYNKIAYKFQRRQFHLAVCFAMTINKS
ncbi:uncharacterized protein LOC143593337 [Bidens hawaiensis]|uniref:uncharacterized protein LOC143593337 n=1 Tax=Bidens hawaiensis TaxID=980011 RepID=UPI0040495662